MTPVLTENPVVVRTERGLSIAGTRVTVYDVMDYLNSGWPSELIRERLRLSPEQLAGVIRYIEENRAQVEAEYREVVAMAAESRRYWEERNQDRFARIAASQPRAGNEALWERLQAWKARLPQED
jgi:uncharacterized protein (DUF433 family)